MTRDILAFPPRHHQDVWYVAYGSNMASRRLAAYIQGGQPDGANRMYTGARDTSLPRDARPVILPGRVHFADYSSVWSGSPVFYNPVAPGPSYGVAYLITAAQFADIAAQEAGDLAGSGPALHKVLATGYHQAGSRAYQTLCRTGFLDGLPMLTITGHTANDAGNGTPSQAYADTIVEGLIEHHGLTKDAAHFYVQMLPQGNDRPAARAA